MRFSYILPAALLAGQAYAAATVHSVLVARQSTADILASIPEQCQDECDSATTILTRCSDSGLSAAAATRCICQANTIPALDNCFDCLLGMVAGVGGDTVAALEQQAKDAMDQLEAGCNAANLPAGGDSSNTDDDADAEESSTGTGTPAASRTSTTSATAPNASASTNGATDDDDDAQDDSEGDLPIADNDAGSASSISLGLGALFASAAGAFLVL